MSTWLNTDNLVDLENIAFRNAWINSDRKVRAIVTMARGGLTHPDLKLTFDSSATAQRMADECQKAAGEMRGLEQQIEAEGPPLDPGELAEFRAWKQQQDQPPDGAS